ncbi:MAG: DUF1552 domain-containing protein [Myxococcota bacterium]
MSVDRRTVLRGLGSVAIGLPFIEGLTSGRARAATGEPPVRCITLFFGLGIPKDMQAEGWDGPLGPLRRHRSKLRMFRNVQVPEAGGGGHPKGGTCVFVGEGGPNGERSAGASIEQIVKKAVYPDGVPVAHGTLAVGQFFRRSHGTYQRIRCWNDDGSRVVEPIEAPSDLFERLFGKETASDDPAAQRTLRLRRSVLDSVLDDYRHYTQDRAGLSGTSRARLQDHLDRLRELERRVFGVEGPECERPPLRTDPDLPYGLAGATEYNAVLVDAQAFSDAYQLNASLFALALQCDLMRFGNLMFESSGGHTAFDGEYVHDEGTYTFRSEASDHNNWHESRWEDVRWHAHWFQHNIAMALDRLDDPAFPDANGGTVLDNALVVLGTETGTNHDMDGVFHAVGGGNGRFALGEFDDDEVRGVEIYNTCLQAYGIDTFMGSADHYRNPVSNLLT